MSLAGRVALVTGAGSDGIGRAAALALAGAGADVVVHHLNQPEAAAALAEQIRSLGRRSAVLAADFATPAAARALVADAIAAMGRVDMLVCTAAVLLRKPALEITDEDWSRVHTINLHGYFAAAQAAARDMVGRGWGRIVLVSSVNQFTPNPGLVAYASAKAGVAMLARSLALELAPSGVTVNLIAPGTIETDFNRVALADPAWRAQKLDLIPMRRIGTPTDVADAVLYLVGAAYATGITITLDGGLELRP